MKPEKINVWMGNVAAKGSAGIGENGRVIPNRIEGRRVTAMGIPLSDFHVAFPNITAVPQGLWAQSSWEKPAWIVCTFKPLEAALSMFYGCPAGAPADILEWAGGDKVPSAASADVDGES